MPTPQKTNPNQTSADGDEHPADESDKLPGPPWGLLSSRQALGHSFQPLQGQLSSFPLLFQRQDSEMQLGSFCLR